MSLYSLSQDLQNALDNLVYDEETGEILSGWEAVEALDMALDKKLENCALAYKNCLADVAAIAGEIKSFQKRKKSAENTAERLKNSIQKTMEDTGKTKFETTRAALSFRQSESVNFTDKKAIPPEFMRQKDPEPDKTAIKKAIKAGQAVPGAELISNRNLQIK